MALTVTVPISEVLTEDVDTLSHTFRSFGGSNVRVGGLMTFPFSADGEDLFDSNFYVLCNAHDTWKCENGSFYSILAASLIDNLVPVDWPGSKDSEGNRYQYQDYFCNRQYKLADGTYLFKMQRRDQANPTGAFLLSDEERRLFETELGILLVKSAGESLIPSEPEEV